MLHGLCQCWCAYGNLEKGSRVARTDYKKAALGWDFAQLCTVRLSWEDERIIKHCQIRNSYMATVNTHFFLFIKMGWICVTAFVFFYLIITYHRKTITEKFLENPGAMRDSH